MGGGLAVGRLHEFYGKESVGKSTLATIFLAMAQKLYPDKFVGVVDAEHAFDEVYAKSLGIDLERCLILRPDVAIEAFDCMFDLAATANVSCFFLDSLASLIAQETLDSDDGQGNAALARVISENIKKTATICSKTMTTGIFSNQKRTNPRQTYGNPEYVVGGNSAKHYFSIRLDMVNAGFIKAGEAAEAIVLGHRNKITCVKNKTARPHQFTEVDFLYDEGGYSKEADLIDEAVGMGLMSKAGSWLTWNPTGDKMQGRERWIKALRADHDWYERMLATIQEGLTEDYVTQSTDQELLAEAEVVE
jgi:recombination protein RecA